MEYFLADEVTYLWVIRKGDVEGPVRIPHGRLELMEKVIACRQAIEKEEEVANYYLALLHDWLIRPVEHLLPQPSNDEVPHLIIIPSGPLYYLPFQAPL